MVELFCFFGIMWFISKVDYEGWIALLWLAGISAVSFWVYCNDMLPAIIFIGCIYFIVWAFTKEGRSYIREQIKGIPKET